MKEERHLFVASGRVVERPTHAGVASLTIEVWGRAEGCLELVDAARTDDGGDFSLEVAEAHLTQLVGARPPLKLRAEMPAGISLSLQRPRGTAEELSLVAYSGLLRGSKSYAGDGAPLGAWTISVAGAAPDALAAVLEDIVLVCHDSVA